MFFEFCIYLKMANNNNNENTVSQPSATPTSTQIIKNHKHYHKELLTSFITSTFVISWIVGTYYSNNTCNGGGNVFWHSDGIQFQ
jgi:hypothetical protein